MKFKISLISILLSITLISIKGLGQNDTLKVMTYNVLHYGDGCQGSNSYLHARLKIIVGYTNPDVLGLVKVQSIKDSASDPHGYNPVHLEDSMLTFGLNAAYPGKYACCPIGNTNQGFDDDMNLLFYNQNKLGYVSTTLLNNFEEVFSLYKLFYKDPNLSATHDSTFLYIILNHTISGTQPSGSISRDHQDSLNVNQLKSMFSHLPNLITMGDFNTHSSSEAGYYLMTSTTDTSFLFYDPPFKLDNKLSYPISWETATAAAPYLNTATRSTSLPNGCGSANGAKDWYLHILLSGWIANNYDYIKYVPNSYTTIGNDGKRTGISIIDSTTNGKNLSAPPAVLEALYEFSDKYPISVKLAVTYNTSGKGPGDPTATVPLSNSQDLIRIVNPIQNNSIDLAFASSLVGQTATMNLYDLTGKLVSTDNYPVNSSLINRPCQLTSGLYILTIQIGNTTYTSRLIK